MGKLILVDQEVTTEILRLMKQLNISEHQVDFNAIRTIYAAPNTNVNGEKEFVTSFDKKILKETINLIESRLKRGEMTVLTNLDLKSVKIKRFIDLANRVRMDLVVIVKDREEFQLKSKTRVVEPNDFEIEMGLKYKSFDMYKKIHHFGDIQGCYEPLEEFFRNGINEDEAYVFMGDLLDRGTENHKVLEFALKNMHRDNFYFLFGNHEAHLLKWANNKKSNSVEFEQRTKKQLELAEISKIETKKLLNKMSNYMFYRKNDILVLASHGGVNFLPMVPEIKSNDEWVWGSKGDVDQQFQSWADGVKKIMDVYQIHGHSNPNQNPINLYPRSLNLEGKIEENGVLRVVTLSDNGFVTKYVEKSVL